MIDEAAINAIFSLYSDNIKVVKTERAIIYKVQVPIISSLQRDLIVSKIYENLKSLNVQIVTRRLKSSTPRALFLKNNNKNYVITVVPYGIGSSESIGI